MLYKETTTGPNTAPRFSHDVVYCKKHCNRRLECGHPCTELCYLPCKSGCVCENQVQATDYASVSNGSPKKKRMLRNSSQYPDSPQRDVPQDTQAYRDFAAGGHVESDKNLVALVERETAKARGKQLDEENFAALFSNQGDDALTDEIEKMTLVRTSSDKEGGNRGLWKGTYKTLMSQDTSPSKREEASLLD